MGGGSHQGGTQEVPARSHLEAGQDNTETGLLWSGGRAFTEGYLGKAETQNLTSKLFSEITM